MRLKKQSMRQMKDAALLDRKPAEPVVSQPMAGKNAVAGHGNPQYFRGALVKPK